MRAKNTQKVVVRAAAVSYSSKLCTSASPEVLHTVWHINPTGLRMLSDLCLNQFRAPMPPPSASHIFEIHVGLSASCNLRLFLRIFFRSSNSSKQSPPGESKIVKRAWFSLCGPKARRRPLPVRCRLVAPVLEGTGGTYVTVCTHLCRRRPTRPQAV